MPNMRAGRVAGLDADQLVVDDDGRDLPVARAHELRQRAHDVDADAQLEVVHRGEDPLEIAAWSCSVGSESSR